ncbi:hypothetical protein L3X38_022942 [Prunus dulcis]|uniref:Uncharacterized protein n=1 Tax=Prunus dulcis TaxID=3755 RepID=A0AAD4Z5P1_PRUDU|nr:hypothetical protein L3X38_022942 [Prunus dulcis]
MPRQDPRPVPIDSPRRPDPDLPVFPAGNHGFRPRARLGRLRRNFGRKSRSLVNGPGVWVLSGIPKDSSRIMEKFGAGPFSHRLFAHVHKDIVWSSKEGKMSCVEFGFSQCGTMGLTGMAL